MFAFIATLISIPIVHFLVTNQSIFGTATIALFAGFIGFYIGSMFYSIFIVFFALAIISTSWKIINIVNDKIKT